MKTSTLPAIALILALLVQTTAALVPMPCASAESPVERSEAASTERPGHAHHADHAAAGLKRDMTPSDTRPTDAPGDCCEGMSPVACAAGGCAAGGTLLMAPVTSLQPVALNGLRKREPEWLPPYGAPAFSIFRPPIA